MTIYNKIDNVEKAIFDYEIINVANNLVNIFSEIIENEVCASNNPNAIRKINELMGECLNALQNKDYLLIADILEYPVKALIGAFENETVSS